MYRSTLVLLVVTMLLVGCATPHSETSSVTPDAIAQVWGPDTASQIHPPAREALNRYLQAAKAADSAGMQRLLADLRRLASERPDDFALQVALYAMLGAHAADHSKKDLLPELEQLHAMLNERMPTVAREIPPPAFWESLMYEKLASEQTDKSKAKFYQEKRREALQRAIKESPDSGLTHLELADYHMYHGSKEVARMEALRARDLIPEDADVYLTLGQLSLKTIHDPDDCWDEQVIDDAIGHFKQAIKLEPSSTAAHDGLSSGYLHKGAYDLAIFEAREAVRLDPSPFYQSALGRRLFHAGNVDQAIAQLERTVSEAPEEQRPHEALGWAYFVDGNYSAASNQYQKWYEASSDHRFYPSLHLALSLQAIGSTDRARRFMSSLEPDDEDDRQEEWKTALLGFHRQELNQEEFLRLANTRCRMTEAAFYIGFQEQIAGKLLEARRHYQSAIDQKVHCYFETAAAKAALERMVGS